MDKKRVNIIVVCVVIGSILLAALLVYVASGILVIDGDKFRVNKETENDIQEVESFFHEKGYDIDIIGAHTNGRDHEGPFSSGWYWYSFELGEKGEEVIMLYHYDNVEQIEEYLQELDDSVRDKCYVSDHFVFYYSGEVEAITNTIIEYCEA